MKFSESHEWIEVLPQSEIGVVGVSNYAQKELGDIVYVELPRIGKDVKAGSEVAVLESTKAAADIYSPVSGTIVEVNEKLKSMPELINQSPETDGWIFKIKLANNNELNQLMDLKAYRAQFQK
jgi:glycine cleavage system H protein